uniref:Prolamin-like domain-containing protein n=1 Tax=Cajanus cajan TaxID=3821 RepID=A0A151TLA1_CAJCA|nr:hypothetical protein KK1_024170 [Cajanus cajan]
MLALALALALACFVACGAATRDSHVGCWSNLNELKSCSSEIMRFFINGHAHITPNCCCAITDITHNCWPKMLTFLGLTYQEYFYVRGYCDPYAPTPALAPAPDGPVSPIY